jgi:hypothetical protein
MAKKPEDLLDMLSSLPSQDGYTPMDRYRDFRKLFLGSDEGKRVLREVLSWGRMFRAPALGNPIDSHRMAVAFGERNIALKLMATINIEPTAQPKPTRKKTS